MLFKILLRLNLVLTFLKLKLCKVLSLDIVILSLDIASLYLETCRKHANLFLM